MLADLQNQLGVDATIGIQFAVFFLFYVWMRFVFFGPFLKLLDARHSSTQGLRERAADLEIDSETKEQKYAERISAARRAAAIEREKILAVARGKSANAIDVARKSAKEKIESSRVKEETEAKNSLANLSGQVSQLRDLFVDKLTNSRMGL
jgi:F0F1-type ATP synthase membrane subunit b/b'